MCLELESKGARPRFFGKHCMVGLRPDGKGLDRGNISKHLLERIPVFDFYYPKLGLCLPSTCRKSDIEQLVKKSKLMVCCKIAVSNSVSLRTRWPAICLQWRNQLWYSSIGFLHFAHEEHQRHANVCNVSDSGKRSVILTKYILHSVVTWLQLSQLWILELRTKLSTSH